MATRTVKTKAKPGAKAKAAAPKAKPGAKAKAPVVKAKAKAPVAKAKAKAPVVKPTSVAKPKPPAPKVAAVAKVPVKLVAPTPVAVVPAAPLVPARVIPAAPAAELAADLPIGRLLEYGATFGKGRVAVQHLPAPLPLPSGRLALGEVDGARYELARQLPAGTYRLFVVRRGDGPEAPPVAIGMYCGRPPIARWVHAHRAGKKPPRTAAEAAAVELRHVVLADAAAPDAPAAELPRGDGAPRAMQPYWGLGPDGAPVCLVIDVGVITAGEWKTARPR